MKIKIKIKIGLAAIILMVAMGSCLKDLNTKPLDPTVTTADDLFSSDSAAIVVDQMLAKCYAVLSVSGQGSDGWRLPDIEYADQGVVTFLRGYWNAQELSTDEAFNIWGDGDLNEYHAQSWSNANGYIQRNYERIFYNIAICNEFIRNIGPKLGGQTPELQAKWTQYIAEVRLLRAFFYYCAMDLWGNVPFMTDKDPVGAFLPPQIKRADLFVYIESELKEINSQLLPANQDPNYYPRVNKAVAWTILAKMYLNAEVYLGSTQPKYTECIAYCDSVINAGYTLHPKYTELFLADNNSTSLDEFIFCASEDGLRTKNYGGTTYLVNAEVGGSMDRTLFGIPNNGWGGNITTFAFMNKFPDPSGATDTRALFYSHGLAADTISDLRTFDTAMAITKFKNITSDGTSGSSPLFVDTDYPIFRLADIYLTYAEAVLRGGTGGSSATALDRVNLVRARAHATPITSTDLTLNFILDERGRELYWEGFRRTDLIRFGQFSNGNYTWDWKGSVKGGVKVDVHFDLYPLPSSDLVVNSNLVQNPGY